jgi:hypothetical protein
VRVAIWRSGHVDSRIGAVVWAERPELLEGAEQFVCSGPGALDVQLRGRPWKTSGVGSEPSPLWRRAGLPSPWGVGVGAYYSATGARSGRQVGMSGARGDR